MSKNIGTGEPTTRAGLFKIRHLGEGQYSIRSMLDNRVGLMFTEADVYLGNVGTSADNVPENAKWIISTNDSGYYVRGANTGKSLALPNVVNDGVEVDWSTYHSNYLNYNWVITKSTQRTHGVYITKKTTTLMADDVFTFEAIFYSSYTNVNGQSGITWKIQNGASFASIDENTGVLTALMPGYVTVAAEYLLSSLQKWVAYCQLYVDISLPEGTYFVRNVETSLLMQPDGENSSNVEQQGFNGSHEQRWMLSYAGNQYYHIQNKATGLYLTASENASEGQSITEQVYDSTIAERQLWKFIDLPNGNYKIQAKQWEGTLLVLAVNTHQVGSQLQQCAYSQDSDYKDTWKITMEQDFYLMYLGDSDGDPAMGNILDSNYSKLDIYMDGEGQTHVESKIDVLERMAGSRIFACITHGLETSITLTGGESLTVADINALSADAFENLELVYYGACRTGANEENITNLVEATYVKGADVVIGFKVNVVIEEAYLWTEVFMNRIAEGCTIDAAMEAADIEVAKIHKGVDFDRDGKIDTTPSTTDRCVKGNRQLAPCG